MSSRVVSIDVECVATGIGHNDRAVAWVAVVTEQGEVIFDSKVLVENIHSAMTVVTGVTEQMLEEEGRPLTEVLTQVHELLGPEVVLVGQSIHHDCEWLDLVKGVHYGKTIDLAVEFRSWNAKYSDWNYFGLAQAAYGLLKKRIQSESKPHNPIEDAQVSLELYAAYVKTGRQAAAQQTLRRMRYKRLFPAPPSYKGKAIDGVCSFAFDPKKCFCGQRTSK